GRLARWSDATGRACHPLGGEPHRPSLRSTQGMRMKSVLVVVFGLALTTAISWWFLSSRPVVHVVAPAAPTRASIPSAPTTSPVDTDDEAADDELPHAAPGTRPEGRKLRLPDVVTG